jgi:hypothetical protein
LQVIEEDAIHTLAVHAEAPNLAEGHKSETPMEAPNIDITTFPKRGPL